MKHVFSICMILYAISSCTGSANEFVPNPPPSPVDSSRPAGQFTFGKLIYFQDTFQVFDANSGKLTLNSPASVIAAAYNPDIIVDSNLVYQSNTGWVTAINLNTGNVVFEKVFAVNMGSVYATSPTRPIIDSQYLYEVFFDFGGSSLYCVNKHTGNIIRRSSKNLGEAYDKRFFSTIAQTGQNIIFAGINGPVCFAKKTSFCHMGVLLAGNFYSIIQGLLTSISNPGNNNFIFLY